MTIDEFLEQIGDRGRPTSIKEISALESDLGASLPDDYRYFLTACNGGHVGGRLWYTGPTPSGASADAGVHHIGGFREEPHFSLAWHRGCYADRIPKDLLWIMDDPFGNAICLGITGVHRSRVYFWDHELEPDPEAWNGQVETAGNLSLIANSFTDFVAGLQPNE